MSYVIAILCLGVACALWYGVQLWVGKPDDPFWSDSHADCDSCVREGKAACSDPPSPSGGPGPSPPTVRRPDCPLPHGH